MLRSALNSHFDGHSARPLGTPGTLRRPTSVLCSSPTPIPKRLPEGTTKQAAGRTLSTSNHPEGVSQGQVLAPPSVPPGGIPSASVLPSGGGGDGRKDWPLWGLYAKFAERCLNDPRLALYALDRAAAAAAVSFPGLLGGNPGGGRDTRCSSGGGGRDLSEKDGKCGGSLCSSLAFIARAQLFQRRPKLLLEGGARSAAGSSGADASAAEEILTGVAERYSRIHSSFPFSSFLPISLIVQ